MNIKESCTLKFPSNEKIQLQYTEAKMGGKNRKKAEHNSVHLPRQIQMLINFLEAGYLHILVKGFGTGFSEQGFTA